VVGRARRWAPFAGYDGGMGKVVGSLKFSLAALLLASLVQPACGDDQGAPAPASGGAPDSDGGADTSGESGGAGNEGGTTSNGSPTGASGEAADAGEPGVETNGGAPGSHGGAPQAGAAGSGGEATLPCAGEVIDGDCFETAFARVQSATRSAGTGVSGDTVKLLKDTVPGNAIVLSVGVIWNGPSQQITVPAGFTLIERADNTTGVSSHESAALYVAESAPALAAATGATVTVGEADARLYLGLAEYAGLRSSGALDRSASATGNGSPSSGATAQTTSAAQLWVVLTLSRGGGGHSAPTNGFEIIDFKNTGAGSFSMMEKLVQTRGVATASLTASGDYAAVIATLRR
jgi:hypothetical protein